VEISTFEYQIMAAVETNYLIYQINVHAVVIGSLNSSLRQDKRPCTISSVIPTSFALSQPESVCPRPQKLSTCSGRWPSRGTVYCTGKEIPREPQSCQGVKG
jgi:hypothetical protein